VLDFNNSGDFLNWWFETRLLQGKALEIFERYYANYRNDFKGYLKKAWTDRHLEVDRELEAGKNREGVQALDVGCGTGSISLYIAGKCENKCEVVGVDINEDRLECARERQKVLEKEVGYNLKCSYMNSDITDLNEKRKFDIIYLEETFHHLEPRLAVVRKISHLLQEGGALIISEVNACNLLIQLQLLKRRGFKTIRWKTKKNGQGLLYGVERIVTAGRLVRLCECQGLKLESLRYFRIANARMGSFIEKRGFDLVAAERQICSIPFVRNLLSVHYNIVFRKS